MTVIPMLQHSTSVSECMMADFFFVMFANTDVLDLW